MLIYGPYGCTSHVVVNDDDDSLTLHLCKMPKPPHDWVELDEAHEKKKEACARELRTIVISVSSSTCFAYSILFESREESDRGCEEGGTRREYKHKFQ